MKIKRRFPNYFTGFEETEHEIETLDELKQIDWVANLLEMKNNLGLFYSPNKDGPDYLMHLSKGKEKIIYFVVGYIFGEAKELGLTDYELEL